MDVTPTIFKMTSGKHMEHDPVPSKQFPDFKWHSCISVRKMACELSKPMRKTSKLTCFMSKETEPVLL